MRTNVIDRYCFLVPGKNILLSRSGGRIRAGIKFRKDTPHPPCCFRGFVGGQIPVILPLTTHQVTNTSPVTSHWAVSVMTVKSALKYRCKDHPASSPLIFPIFSHVIPPFFFFLVSERCCPQGSKIGKHPS